MGGSLDTGGCGTQVGVVLTLFLQRLHIQRRERERHIEKHRIHSEYITHPVGGRKAQVKRHIFTQRIKAVVLQRFFLSGS